MKTPFSATCAIVSLIVGIAMLALAGEPLFKPTGKYAQPQPAPRSTHTTGDTLHQVDRGAASPKVVYVVGSTTCYPCKLFRDKHGDGTADMRYIYCYMDKPRPETIDVATWNELVKLNNSGRFLYPFFVVKVDGEFVGAQARVD